MYLQFTSDPHKHNENMRIPHSLFVWDFFNMFYTFGYIYARDDSYYFI